MNFNSYQSMILVLGRGGAFLCYARIYIFRYSNFLNHISHFDKIYSHQFESMTNNVERKILYQNILNPFLPEDKKSNK